MKRYRIMNYKRFYIFIASIIMISSFIGIKLINKVNLYDSSIENKRSQYFEVAVSSGETLWDIANRYQVTDGDIRHNIQLIKNYNNINSSLNLQENTIIKIPLK